METFLASSENTFVKIKIFCNCDKIVYNLKEKQEINFLKITKKKMELS